MFLEVKYAIVYRIVSLDQLGRILDSSVFESNWWSFGRHWGIVKLERVCGS